MIATTPRSVSDLMRRPAACRNTVSACISYQLGKFLPRHQAICAWHTPVYRFKGNLHRITREQASPEKLTPVKNDLVASSTELSSSMNSSASSFLLMDSFCTIIRYGRP